jgi:hypothetical protein
MENNDLCKGCKGISKTLFLHGGKYFQRNPYNAYKVSFLRLDSVGYGYDLVGSFGKNALIPPRLLNNNQLSEAKQ